MGKPIIHSVEDAIAIFYTTGLDALVLGNILIEKWVQIKFKSGSKQFSVGG